MESLSMQSVGGNVEGTGSKVKKTVQPKSGKKTIRKGRPTLASSNRLSAIRCNECDLSFPDCEKLQRHNIVLHGHDPIGCAYSCGKSFTSMDGLRAHIKGYCKVKKRIIEQRARRLSEQFNLHNPFIYTDMTAQALDQDLKNLYEMIATKLGPLPAMKLVKAFTVSKATREEVINVQQDFFEEGPMLSIDFVYHLIEIQNLKTAATSNSNMTEDSAQLASVHGDDDGVDDKNFGQHKVSEPDSTVDAAIGDVSVPPPSSKGPAISSAPTRKSSDENPRPSTSKPRILSSDIINQGTRGVSPAFALGLKTNERTIAYPPPTLPNVHKTTSAKSKTPHATSASGVIAPLDLSSVFTQIQSRQKKPRSNSTRAVKDLSRKSKRKSSSSQRHPPSKISIPDFRPPIFPYVSKLSAAPVDTKNGNAESPSTSE